MFVFCKFHKNVNKKVILFTADKNDFHNSSSLFILTFMFLYFYRNMYIYFTLQEIFSGMFIGNKLARTKIYSN